MHVVRHQAVTQQRQLIKLGVLAQQIQIDDTLVIVGENKLAGVSPLGDVVRYVNYGDTSHPCHTRTISGNVPSVPRFPAQYQETSRLSQGFPSVPRFHKVSPRFPRFPRFPVRPIRHPYFLGI